MDSQRQRWLMRMINAAVQAADRVEDAADPYHAALHADLVELRDRLRVELKALERDA